MFHIFFKFFQILWGRCEQQVSKEEGSFPLRKEWHKRQFCNSTMSLILRIFHSLNRGEDESRKLENNIMLNVFLIYNI